MPSYKHSEPTASRLRRRMASFAAAIHGLIILSREAHSRVHLVATLAVVVAGVCLDVSVVEWCVLVLAIGVVWVAEAFNTALEHMADAAVPEPHPLVGAAKDVAAAAVLLGAIASAVVGVLIFARHLVG